MQILDQLNISGLSQGDLLFGGASNLVTWDGANLYFDDTNYRFAVGLNSSLDSTITAKSGGSGGRHANIRATTQWNNYFFGHTNTDYLCTLGAFSGNSTPFISFYGYHSTTANTIARASASNTPAYIGVSTAGVLTYNVATLSTNTVDSDVSAFFTPLTLNYSGSTCLSTFNTSVLATSYQTSALSTPGAATVTPTGITGSTTYGYRVSALSQYGETLASTETQTSTGNATLTSGNYNAISWSAVTGAASYKIYRTTANGTPNTVGLIGTINAGVTLSLNDTGLTASGSAVVYSLAVLTGGSSGTNGSYTDGAFTGGGGSGATFNYTVVGNVLSTVTLTAIGSGYTSLPTPTFTNGSFSVAPTLTIVLDPCAKQNTTSWSTIGGSGATFPIYITTTLTDYTSGTRPNLRVVTITAPTTSVSAANHVGQYFTNQTSGACNFVNIVGGSLYEAIHGGTGTVGELTPLRMTMQQNAGAGAITLARTLANMAFAASATTVVGWDSTFQAYNAAAVIGTVIHHRALATGTITSGATVTNIFGYQANNLGKSGVTNVCGIAIAAQTGATNNTCFQVGSTTIASGNHGTVLIAPAAATVASEIRGASSQTADLTDWEDSSANVMSYMNANGLLAVRQGQATSGTYYAKVGGSIFDHYANAANSGSTETTLYTDTIPANVLINNGDTIEFEYYLITATNSNSKSINIYFGGNAIATSGTSTFSAGFEFVFRGTITRTSNTVVRTSYTMLAISSFPATSANFNMDCSDTNLSPGLTSSQILKITGTGGATNDVTANRGKIYWRPAA